MDDTDNAKTIRVGVLALQGAFNAHCKYLKDLGVDAVEVKYKEQLKECDGLIIPGGESTVMANLLDRLEMRSDLLLFAQSKPVWGTCAGLILLAKEVDNAAYEPLKLMDISVERNAYGSQAFSFRSWIPIACNGNKNVSAVFIRAPKIKKLLSSEVVVYGWHEQEPVFVRQNHLLATTFHPELSGDLSIHQFFIKLVREQAEISTICH